MARSHDHDVTDVRDGAAVSRPTGWLVTPTQAIMGRKGPFKYRLYFGAGGLAFGLLVGVISGMRIGRRSGDHGASADGPRTIKAPGRPRWPAATSPRARWRGPGRPSTEPEAASANRSDVTDDVLGTHPAQTA